MLMIFEEVYLHQQQQSTGQCRLVYTFTLYLHFYVFWSQLLLVLFCDTLCDVLYMDIYISSTAAAAAQRT